MLTKHQPTDNHISLVTYFSILFIAFIGFIGISVPFPAMVMVFLDDNSPFLVAETSPYWRNVMTGCALGTYPLMQSFGSPLIGQLSDRYGRKKVLLISLALSSLGYVLTSLAAWSGLVALFFLGRMICGLAQGNIAIALSTASDLSSGATKKRLFANINAGAYLAFLIGPLLGGWLANHANGLWCGYHAVFAFSSTCTGLAVLVAFLSFPHLPPSQQAPKAFSLLKEFKAIQANMNHQAIRPYFFIAAFLFLGINIFLEFNNVFFVNVFDFSVGDVGFFVSYFSIFSISAQLCFNSKIFQRIPLMTLLITAMLGLISSIVILVLVEHSGLIWILLPLIALSFAFSKTSFQLLVSENASKDHQGSSIGLAEGLDVFCDAVAAVLGGVLASIHYRLPLCIAALSILAAFILTRVLFQRTSLAIKFVPQSGE